MNKLGESIFMLWHSQFSVLLSCPSTIYRWKHVENSAFWNVKRRMQSVPNKKTYVRTSARQFPCDIAASGIERRKADRTPDLVWLTPTGINHVGRVYRSLAGVVWVHHGAQFEVHSAVDEQPVELPQSWSYVLVHPYRSRISPHTEI